MNVSINYGKAVAVAYLHVQYLSTLFLHYHLFNRDCIVFHKLQNVPNLHIL